MPKSFGEFILKKAGIAIDEKCHKIDGKTRDKILELLQNFAVTITGTDNAGEVVTCGGLRLMKSIQKQWNQSLLTGCILSVKFLISMVFAVGLIFKTAGLLRLLLPAGLSQYFSQISKSDLHK